MAKIKEVRVWIKEAPYPKLSLGRELRAHSVATVPFSLAKKLEEAGVGEILVDAKPPTEQMKASPRRVVGGRDVAAEQRNELATDNRPNSTTRRSRSGKRTSKGDV